MLPRSRLFWTVSLGHLTVDMFNGAIPVLLTFLSGHLLAMSNTQIGFAISTYQLMGAVSQPLCGWLADRSGGRWLGTGGVAWMVGLIVLSLVVVVATHSYVLMLIPLVLAALGSGAFHPIGTMHAADSDRRHVTSNLSLFFLMGSVGGALGPVIIGVLLDRAASHNALFTAQLGPVMAGRLQETGSIIPILVFALVALPIVLLMGLVLPSARAHNARPAEASRGGRRVELAPLGVLMLVITLRGLVNPGLVSFLPRLFEARGYSPSEYGLITSLYWIGGGVMMVVFGHFADRHGSRRLIIASLLLAAPAVWGLTVANGSLIFVLALAVGAFSGGSHSLIVAMTQKMMPTGRGLASGAALGVIFGMGALCVLVIGAVADRIGLESAFQFVALTAVVTGLLAFLLPEDRRQTESAVVEDVVRPERASPAGRGTLSGAGRVLLVPPVPQVNRRKDDQNGSQDSREEEL